MTGPPEEAYGRVTNPERYAAVQHAARDLVAELTSSFDVEVVTGRAADPMLIERTPGVVIDDVVRLVPRSHGAAPLTVAFTNFPAVLVRAGQWGVGAYPRCGCDACDEDPAWVIEELRRDVDALTAGRVVEKWDGTRLTTTTAYADGGSSSGWTLIDRDRDLYGEPREYAWLPWT